MVKMPFTKKRYKTRKLWRKYLSCIKKVKKKGGVKSVYAVCRKAIYGRKK